MGIMDLLFGSAKHTGNAPLQTQGQQDLLSGGLSGMGPQLNSLLMSLLQPGGQQGYQDLFQQSFIDPAMRTYEQQVLPAIQQRFVDANAGSSSALNQALGQSAADLSTMLGSQMGQFQQQQQQIDQSGNMNAIQALLGLGGQRSFEPIVQKQQGMLGPLITAGATLAAGPGGGMAANALMGGMGGNSLGAM